MRRSVANVIKRALVAMLCVAMVVSSVSLSAFAVGSDEIINVAQVLSDNNEIQQLSTSLEDESDIIAVSDATEGSKPVLTATKNYAYAMADVPRYNYRYVFLHEATGAVMSYKAYEPEKPATSIVYNQEGNADNAYFFATDAKGNVDKSKLYIDHSDRDEALWLLRQEKNDKYGTVNNNDELSKDTDITVDGLAEPFLTTYEGAIRYHHAYFYKGIGPLWNANGTIADSVNGNYWYSIDGLDAEGIQERYLMLFPDNMFQFNRKDQNNENAEVQIEPQEDGTYIIFWRDSAASPDNFYLLTCDDEGNWKTVVTTKNGMTEEIRENSKFSLYRYISEPGFKTVSYKGYQNYDVVAGTSKEDVLETIAQNITVMNATNKNLHIPYSGEEGKVGYYNLQFNREFDSSAGRAQSNYIVTINYRNDDGTDTLVGSIAVNVHNELAIKGTASITNLSGTVPQNTTEGYIVQNIADDENIDCVFTVKVRTASGVVQKTVPVTVGMLTDKNGTAVSTVTNGVTENLTLTYMGEVITDNFTLTVDDTDESLNYPVYPEEGSVTVSKTGTAVGKFNETGVANINLTTTGIPQNKGVDMIVVMDLSGSMSYGVTNTVRVDDETSRLYALQESLRAMITTLKTSDVDYRIAMSDFGDIDSYEFDKAVVDKTNPAKYYFDADADGHWDQRSDWAYGSRYEYYNHLNFVHGTYGADYTDENGDTIDLDNRAMPYNVYERKFEKAWLNYTGKIVPNIYTGSHTVGAEAFVNVDTFDDSAVESLLNEVAIHQKNSIGTNYDVGLEYAYQLGYAIQQDNIEKGLDRDIICVFMSDGAAMQYNYFSGRAVNQSWADWLKGDIEFDKFQHNAPSDVSASTELVSIMNSLLKDLKAGTLKNPKYGVRVHSLNANGEESPNTASVFLEPKIVTEDTETQYYFDFSAVDISNVETFYDAMGAINVDLYWELLCRIADANGLKGYVNAQDVEDELLALAKEDKLLYPMDEAEFYPQYTGTCEDFFTALEELGVNCNWELLTQIAISNVSDAKLSNAYAEITTLAEGKEWGTLSPYYYFYNEEGKNWYAEAIKGSRSELYPVINKYAFSNNSEDTFAYYGDVRNNFSTDTGLELDGKDYISGFRGLEIPIYTVGLSLCTENYLTEQIAKDVLANISSGQSYAFTANNKEELIDVFNTIGTSSSVAATGGYFVDKMGPEFDLYTRKTVTNGDGETVTINVEPTIKVLEYKLDANHDRTGNPIVYETVTISEDAQGNLIVKSDKIYTTEEDKDGNLTQVYPNILQSNGIIKAKYFYYNTNKYVDENNTGTIGIDLTGDGKTDWQLEAETFFWIVGPISNTEMVLDYQVYLTGAMEGTRELGVYETNTSAKLGYVNYLGNNCSKDTVSPAFPWPSPFAGYAFYLVDENGKPLNANGDVSTFIDSFKITNPAYIEMLLNGAANNITPDDILSEELDLMYEIYDPSAGYEVAVNSDGAGYWEISKSDSLANTTYVTNYGSTPTNKNSSELSSTVAYDRTVVWFALKIKNMTNPDTVVIDYGLPVEVDVLANDALFSSDYTLDYISNADDISSGDKTLDEYLSSVPAGETALISSAEASGAYGVATKNGNKVVYTPDTENGMQMSEEEVFVYGAYYGGTGTAKTGKGYYYSSLTVIPATTIYFEDNFVTFNAYDHDTGAEITAETPHYDELKWTDAGEYVSSVQAQDRPGEYPLKDLDANNVYGYDGAYKDMNLYSMGSSKVINVGTHTFADGTTAKVRGTAKFTFKGTGFDIISLTSNTTGSIVVQVAGKDDVKNVNKFFMVDTYYGYMFDGKDWVVDTEADSALYQIPVMKVEDLPYGKYDVTITVAYSELFDHQQYGDAKNFDFYLDAIRIYDPANDGANSKVIEDAYIADKEGWPLYEEVRNLILKAESFGTAEDNQVVNGAVFIDNTKADESGLPAISDYHNYGPNNEVYLAPGQAIAFELDAKDIEKAFIAFKSVSSKPASIKIFDADTNQADAPVREVNSATDLYYDITSLAGKVVVIYNCSQDTGELISVTNIRTTHAQNPSGNADVARYVRMSREIAMVALNAFVPKPVVETTTEAQTTTACITETATAEQTTVEITAATENTEVISSETTGETTDASAVVTPTETVTETTAATDATEGTVSTEPKTDATEPTEVTEPKETEATTESITTEPQETSASKSDDTNTTVSGNTTEPTQIPEDDYILGDANSDKKVNIKDTTAIQKHIAKLIVLADKALKAADYDVNDIVNIKDATAIQKFLAGIL